ncbi:MAG: hypothetical protein GXP35_14435 [Actinobacteria bacterium]|nr:hypothetical protein [Actinomycetota bacterium]
MGNCDVTAATVFGMASATTDLETSDLRYDRDDLMRSHDYAAPHVVNGERLHGGMMADGSYMPPRALVREAAFTAWEVALGERGGEPLDADASLLDGLRMPTADQQGVLLRNGIGAPFWNGLTITGKIEARGRALATMQFPELQPAIVEDISEMAIGHLNEGLLVAHGLDEGGSPEEGIGGHDTMWFVVRDLVFGRDAYDDADPPESIGRSDSGGRLVEEVDAATEGLISFLANLLIIEFRAENAFADTQAILRKTDLFTDRRADAEVGAEIVERIRTDEAIHVRSLCLYLGELRSVTFKTLDGGTMAGAELIDRFWDGLVRWATVDQPAISFDRDRAVLEEHIAGHTDSARVLAEFNAAS